jgi:hypothetical protein
MNKDAILTRLVELIQSGIDSPIEKLQSEVKESQREAEQRAKEQASNQVYRIQRVALRQVYNSFVDAYENVVEPIEYAEIRYVDMQRWADHRGIDKEELLAALENRQKEVKDKTGSIWRAYPFTWVDRSQHTADLEQDQIESQQFVEFIEGRNKRLKQATADKLTAPKLNKFLTIEPQAATRR